MEVSVKASTRFHLVKGTEGKPRNAYFLFQLCVSRLISEERACELFGRC